MATLNKFLAAFILVIAFITWVNYYTSPPRAEARREAHDVLEKFSRHVLYHAVPEIRDSAMMLVRRVKRQEVDGQYARVAFEGVVDAFKRTSPETADSILQENAAAVRSVDSMRHSARRTRDSIAADERFRDCAGKSQARSFQQGLERSERAALAAIECSSLLVR